MIWSSSYTRAKATAKYIANVNNLPFNLDSNLGERKLGNLKELGEFMKDMLQCLNQHKKTLNISFSLHSSAYYKI